MPSVPPPNQDLLDLAAILGEDNVRTLVRTFLRDFPVSLRGLHGGERKDRHRFAHSMKSNSRLMGARHLSQLMAGLETRLEQADGVDVGATELAEIVAEYEAIARPLRAFVGQ